MNARRRGRNGKGDLVIDGHRDLRGRFLTFEGVDGCGKSTQSRLLVERLRDAGYPVTATREPGGTEIGRQLRAVLLNAAHAEMQPGCELLLYLADRVQHLHEVIRPALERGEVVVCDRYHDATVAYQGHARGLDLAALGPFIAAEVGRTPPDTTFWLDVPVPVAQARIAARNAADAAAGTGPGDAEARLDRAAEDFHERVRAGYAAIHAAEPARVVRIDAGDGPDALHDRIWQSLTERYHVG